MQIVEGYEFLKFILQTLDTEVPTTSPNHALEDDLDLKGQYVC